MMDRLTSIELANWSALYLATALCCAIAATLASGTLVIQLAKDRPWQSVATLRGAAVLIPKTWWRWQKLYLLSTPVTLAIVGAFAVSLSWT
jgi:hypothetical protein